MEIPQLEVFIWRHGGHVGVQNNAVKCLLGIWLYYYAKLEKFPKDLFAIVLSNKMAAVTSRAIKRFSIGGFHLTSRRPCWCTKQRCKMSFGNLTIIMQNLRSSQKTFSLLFFITRWPPWRHVQSNDFLWAVFIWRHGGHVGVQNNAVKCLLGIWLLLCKNLWSHFLLLCTPT